MEGGGCQAGERQMDGGRVVTRGRRGRGGQGQWG